MASRRVAKGHEIILRPEPSRKICWLTPPAGGPSSPFRPRSKIFDESGRDFGGPRRGDGPDGVRGMIAKWKFRLSCAQAKPQALRRPNEKLNLVRRARETRPTLAKTFSKQHCSSFRLGKLGSEPLRTF